MLNLVMYIYVCIYDIKSVLDKSSSWDLFTKLHDDLGDGASLTVYLLWCATRPSVPAYDGKLMIHDKDTLGGSSSGGSSSDRISPSNNDSPLRTLVHAAESSQWDITPECNVNSACDAMGMKTLHIYTYTYMHVYSFYLALS